MAFGVLGPISRRTLVCFKFPHHPIGGWATRVDRLVSTVGNDMVMFSQPLPPQGVKISSPEEVKEQDPDQSRGGSQQEGTDANIQNKILEASLPFVTELGWSKASISAGAEFVGYPGVIHGMFPRGGFELVHYFYQKSNKELVSQLSTQSIAMQNDPLLKKNESQIATEAIEIRLKMLEPYLKQWPQALALMSLPPNVPTSLANLLTLIDDIAYYAGDRSIDMSWYGKRLLLCGVYKSTELYMIQDGSEGKVETWNFLRRRIQEVDQLHSYILQTGQASQFATEFATAAFITARNILGMSWKRDTQY